MSSTRTGQQVLADFVQQIVVEAHTRLEAIRQQYENATTDSEREIGAEKLEQATVELAVARTIKELADRNQLTERRLQSKLKELRG